MKIEDKRSGESLEAIIEQVATIDFAKIRTDKRFLFDWDLEKDNKVYKIFLLDKQENILGLMSLIDYPNEYRIHINLIEVSRFQVGKTKDLDNIAGCLIAFACSIAYKMGYGGFVSLLPKTQLIELYQNKYGFRQLGRLMAVEFEASKSLIDK